MEASVRFIGVHAEPGKFVSTISSITNTRDGCQLFGRPLSSRCGSVRVGGFDPLMANAALQDLSTDVDTGLEGSSLVS